MIDAMKALGERVYQLRHTKGRWTQAELASACGMSPTTLARLEGGHLKSLTIVHLVALADHFDVSVDYLLGRKDEQDTGRRPSAA